MDIQLVDYKAEGGVAVIALKDPPMNAYTHEMMKDLDDAILEARFDADVHVVVVTGWGEKFFCAGANIKMLSEVDSSFKYYFYLHANETLCRLESTPKVVVAELNGHTVGGGLEIALACDFRIARKGAGKIGLPEVGLGVLPGIGGTQRLPRLVGKSRAMRLLLEGTNLEFEEAHDMGLVDLVVEAETREAFHQRVVEWAQRFLPPGKAPLATGAIKRAVQSGLETGVPQGLALERELVAQLFASDDAREGFEAFVSKRRAEFRGR